MNPTKSVVCPGCTLLCDDIELTKSGSKIFATNACDMGKAFFQIDSAATSRNTFDGKTVSLDTAIVAAAEILNRSKSPLICGLDQLTTEAQQAAWKLADKLGATIDTTLSNGGRGSMFALQRVGKVTATIGEIANRSDLIVFWFCDPETTHPRLMQRLNKSADRPHRRLIVIDQMATKTSQQADAFIQVDRDSCPAFLAVLRGDFAEFPMNEDRVRESTGIELETIRELATALEQATYGSIFYGQSTPDSAYDPATHSLSQLIKQLNHRTRIVGIKLRTDFNALSGENVLAWSSGYPFAVNHHLQYPRFNGLEYSSEKVLARGQCDAILFATGLDRNEMIARLPQAARDHLDSIPKIALTPFPDFAGEVAIQVGIPGLTEGGEFCRVDDVSLPLLSTQSSDRPSSAAILNRICERCR